MSIYALYEGERSIADGTIYQIAEVTGLKPATLKWYGTPSGQKKGNMALVKIEEDDEMIINAPNMRSQRSFAGKAPIPSNYETEATAPVKTTYRHIEMKPFKFESRWINYQLDGMFKNW